MFILYWVGTRFQNHYCECCTYEYKIHNRVRVPCSDSSTDSLERGLWIITIIPVTVGMHTFSVMYNISLTALLWYPCYVLSQCTVVWQLIVLTAGNIYKWIIMIAYLYNCFYVLILGDLVFPEEGWHELESVYYHFSFTFGLY